MLYLLIAIIALGAVLAAWQWVFHRHEPEAPIVQAPGGDCSSCSGIDPTCEQTCMMEAATKEIEYYDDEELDVFRGRPSDQYNDDEVELFSQVLYTLQPQEVKPWGRSLTLRGIQLPDQIKDEYINMAG